MYSDETLSCVECHSHFIFTTAEQQFFASKGFANKPDRCPACRQARKAQRSSGGSASFGPGPSAGRGGRQTFKATCSQCGQTADVPFLPRGGKPVYCRACFASRGKPTDRK